jgi:glycosyltransferase involved in cell wall biosynthesis
MTDVVHREGPSAEDRGVRVDDASPDRDVGGELPVATKWVVLGATSRSAAERYAAAAGLGAATVLTRSELKRSPLDLRRDIRRKHLDRAVAHSVDWSRQSMPQVFELALLAAPVSTRFIVDGRSGELVPWRRTTALRTVARLPLDVTEALGLVTGACVKFQAFRRLPGARRQRLRSTNPAVLVIWLGSLESRVGGSVTHISGIVDGYRQLGLKVGLVTFSEPPPQLGRLIDDIELVGPLSRAARLAADVTRLAANGPVEHAALKLATRLHPAFMYQRHTGFLYGGARAASRARLPLVLEWNGSEVWARAEWERPVRVARTLNGLHRAIEQCVVRSADLVPAVSTHAAAMALDAGADARTVVVSPNAANTAEISELTMGIERRAGPRPLIGWVGSFGPWHGAENLVAAVAGLKEKADVVMIGDGRERDRCRALAVQLGVDDIIEWPGSLPHGETIRRLARCDVLVAPHVPLAGQPFFGSPTKLFEYMAIGRPIVASNLDQLGEVLVEGRTAVLVNPGDVASLIDGLSKVLAMPGRGQALGQAAAREACDIHDWKHRAATIVDRLEAQTRASGRVPQSSAAEYA